MSRAAWDIYAAELAPLGYGYPLWVPDPAPGRRPVAIGDVGWVQEGEFHVMFNAFSNPHDLRRDESPAGFVPLDRSKLRTRGPRQAIGQTLLCSQSIQYRNISGGFEVSGATSTIASGGAGFTFDCTGHSGALLMLQPDAMSHDILSIRAVESYVDANADSWLEFATNALGLDLREEDIRFVVGTKTTSQWAVAAFRGSRRNIRGTFTGTLASAGTASVSLTLSDESLPVCHYRAGPPEPADVTAPEESGPSSSRPETQYNQCIFIRSVRRKKKRLNRLLGALRARAGPHELPPRPDDLEPAAPLLAVEDCAEAEEPPDELGRSTNYITPEVVDPVDVLLDYILENSNARRAVASDDDSDHYRLLGEQSQMFDWPTGLQAILSHLNPAVHVNPNGVGTLQTSARAAEDEELLRSQPKRVKALSRPPVSAIHSKSRVNPEPRPYSAYMTEIRAELRTFITEQLRQITNSPTASMIWGRTSFMKSVAAPYRVGIEGWPYKQVQFKNLSDVYDLSSLELLLDRWKSGSIRFVRLTEEQFRAMMENPPPWLADPVEEPKSGSY